MILSPAHSRTSTTTPHAHMEHQFQQSQQQGRRTSSAANSNTSFSPAVEGRRRARLQQSSAGTAHFYTPQAARDPYKRASLHEPLMHLSGEPSMRWSPAAMSTLAIPQLDPPRSSASHHPRDFLNPANSNFILRKSKSTAADVAIDRDQPHYGDDEGLADSYSDDDKEKVSLF